MKNKTTKYMLCALLLSTLGVTVDTGALYALGQLALFDFVLSAPAQSIFEQFGFEPPIDLSR